MPETHTAPTITTMAGAYLCRTLTIRARPGKESKMFSIGQKVMCVDGKPRKNGMCRPTDEVLIDVGSIYTDREIIDTR
jgi:hypothetical protein